MSMIVGHGTRAVVSIADQQRIQDEFVQAPSTDREEKILVARSRRMSVEAGSMASARESKEREDQRNLEKDHGHQAAMTRMQDDIAAKLITTAKMFVFWDEGNNGCISRDGFSKVMAALGMDQAASMSIFSKVDIFGEGFIPYAAFLKVAFCLGLARSSARIVELCRDIDLGGSNSGFVAQDDFRLALSRLGWEVPSIVLIDEIFDSMDEQGDGNGRIKLSKLTTRLRGLAPAERAEGIKGVSSSSSTKNRYSTRGTLEEQFYQSLFGTDEQRDRAEAAHQKLDDVRKADAAAMQRRQNAVLASRQIRATKQLVDSSGVGSCRLSDGHPNGNASVPRTLMLERPDETNTPRRRRSISVDEINLNRTRQPVGESEDDTPPMAAPPRRRSISSEIMFSSSPGIASHNQISPRRRPSITGSVSSSDPPTRLQTSLSTKGPFDAEDASAPRSSRRASKEPSEPPIGEVGDDASGRPGGRRLSNARAPPLHMFDSLDEYLTPAHSEPSVSPRRHVEPTASRWLPATASNAFTHTPAKKEWETAVLIGRGSPRAEIVYTGVPNLTRRAHIPPAMVNKPPAPELYASPREPLRPEFRTRFGDPLTKRSLWDEKKEEARNRGPFDERANNHLPAQPRSRRR